jgi:uncharacterized lipoprotein YmbA
MMLVAGAALALGGCQSTETNPRFFWRVPPEQKAAFAQAENACRVEVEKVKAPYLAADDPILANEAARRTWVACLRGKGYVLSRIENG